MNRTQPPILASGSRRFSGGLTLLEVVIALLLLTVGILAAAGLQASSLRASRTAESVQSLNAEARSEIDVWRVRLETPYSDHVTYGCVTNARDCTIEIRPCAVDGTGLDCSQASVPTPAAQQVTVHIERDGRVATVDTVVLLRKAAGHEAQ